MKPLRILIVTESKEVWGAERTLLELAANVDRTLVTLTFLLAEDSPLAPLVSRLGFEVQFHRFADHKALTEFGGLGGANRKTLIHEVISSALGGLRLAPKVRRHDVVLSFSIWQAIETLIAARLSFRPFALDLHETFSGEKGHSIVRLIIRLSRAVIAPSLSVLQRSCVELTPKVRVVPRPVSTGRTNTETNRTAGSAITIGIFGQISPHKGVKDVVSAVAQTDSDALRLIVVGGRPSGSWSEYETDVRRTADDVGDRVVVHDAVSDVFPLMATCDFIVNASDHEAFGRGVVESIAAGSIPIAIGHAGPREIIQDTGIGVLLDSVEDLVPYVKGIVDGVTTLPPTDWPRVMAAVARYEPSLIANEYFSHLRRHCGKEIRFGARKPATSRPRPSVRER